MTFASASLEANSERFMLVEMRPKKYVSAGTSIGGNDYTWTLTVDEVYAVEVNGVTVAGASWSYTGGLLTVNSATNLASSTNFVVIETRVYLTGTKIRDTTAGVSGLQSTIWLPYILKYPEWSQSARNITEGVFTIASTSLQVISDDRWIQNRLSTVDSWYRTSVYVWLCIDTLENNRLVFNGEVSSLSIKNNIVTFDIADAFQALNKTATFGTQAQAFSIDGGAYSATVYPADQNKPIPLIIGKTSPMNIAPGYRISEAYGTPAAVDMYHPTGGLKCVPITNNIGTATSLDYLVGRMVGTDFKYITFGTITRAYEHYITKTVYADAVDCLVYVKLLYLHCSAFDGEIGDFIPVGSEEYYVCAKAAFSHAGNDYNVALSSNTYFFDNSTPTSGAVVVASLGLSDGVIPSIGVWIEGDTPASYQIADVPLGLVPRFAIPKYSGRSVSFSPSLGTSYTLGGQSITHVYLTITSTDISATEDPDLPGKFEFRCRFSPGTELTHSEAMEFVCKSAGLTVDATTFSAADTDLVANVVMASPSVDSNGYGKYLDLTQSIAKSTLGLLTVNEDREVEYTIIPDPDGETSIGTRNTVNMLEGDSSARVDYQDIYSEYIFDNPQYRGLEALNPSGPGPATIVTVNKAKYLHKSDRAKTIVHVLEDVTNRKSDIAAYLSEPNIEYSFSTSSEDLNSNIGDVVTIENNMIADSTTTKKVMIVAIDATGSKTQIKTNELRGL